MKNFLMSIMLLLASEACFGQQFPLFTQQLFDPYLLNPSMVASAGRAELNLLYRQQWTGIQDGPKTFQTDFQYPFNERLAIGFTVFDDRTILLSNTSAMATFGYKVYFNKEQYIGFGLSGGIMNNRIRLEDLGPAEVLDDALLRGNSTAINGQFGFHYAFRNLSVGFAILQLFSNDEFSGGGFQGVSFDKMQNLVGSVNYRFPLSDMIHVQPNFTYRFNANALNGFETSAIFSYDNQVFLGAGYRESFGPLVMARVKIADFHVGYAYDLPSKHAQVSTGGTNEIQLKWQFGKEVDEGQYSIYKNYNRWYKNYKRDRRNYRKKLK